MISGQTTGVVHDEHPIYYLSTTTIKRNNMHQVIQWKIDKVSFNTPKCEFSPPTQIPIFLHDLQICPSSLLISTDKGSNDLK